MNSILLTIPGQPVSKGRPRFFRGHAYTPKNTRDYEKKVAVLALKALQESGLILPISETVAVAIRLYMGDDRRRDGDNMVKSITDAMNGIIYEDDSQIKQCYWEIFRTSKDQARAEVEIGKFIAR